MRGTLLSEGQVHQQAPERPVVLKQQPNQRFKPAGAMELAPPRDAVGFGVLEPTTAVLLETAQRCHSQAGRGVSRMTLIVAPREAPLDDQRRDDDVLSFLATADLLNRIDVRNSPAETWCFQLLHSILSASRMKVDIQVIHKEEELPAAPAAPSYSFDVIIPHRGLERHLRLCVDSIIRQQANTRISVAIDQKPRCAKFLNDVRDNPSVRAYRLSPSPVGPYVARHRFGCEANADFLVWQDSDDVSLPSRLATLAAAATDHDAGVVGSHELRLHEIDRRVLAVRYPLDASAGLDRIGAAHQVLFPMTMIRRDIFCGRRRVLDQ